MRRHVAKTGVIRELIVTEEAGIAKGIRRIIAVTGDEAKEVGLRADELASRLEAIAATREARARDSALKTFGTVRR